MIIIKVSKNYYLFYYILNIDNFVPAPNTYKIKTLMGTIYNSKYRSGNLISMSPKFKYKDSRTGYPGPGTYLRFSEMEYLFQKMLEGLIKKIKI